MGAVPFMRSAYGAPVTIDCSQKNNHIPPEILIPPLK